MFLSWIVSIFRSLFFLDIDSIPAFLVVQIAVYPVIYIIHIYNVNRNILGDQKVLQSRSAAGARVPLRSAPFRPTVQRQPREGGPVAGMPSPRPAALGALDRYL